jgi:hypothetical protein
LIRVLAFLAMGIWVGISGTAASNGLPDATHYTACNEDVPVREYPDMFASRNGTIPKGALVIADQRKDRWVRIIYRRRDGFIIGWSLTALLCPVVTSN